MRGCAISFLTLARVASPAFFEDFLAFLPSMPPCRLPDGSRAAPFSTLFGFSADFLGSGQAPFPRALDEGIEDRHRTPNIALAANRRRRVEIRGPHVVHARANGDRIRDAIINSAADCPCRALRPSPKKVRSPTQRHWTAHPRRPYQYLSVGVKTMMEGRVKYWTNKVAPNGTVSLRAAYVGTPRVAKICFPSQAGITNRNAGIATV